MTTFLEKPQKTLTRSRWIWLTTAGWFIGILFVVALALLSEALLHMTEDTGSQAAVGIGMGAGVGLMQWVVLRQYLSSIQKWIWFSIAGFAISYLAFDLISPHVDLNIAPELALPVATAIGAMIAGILQSGFILKKLTPGASKWIGYQTVGWVLAHLSVTGLMLPNQDFHPGKVLIVVFALVFLTIGGPILGFITGIFMIPCINNQGQAISTTSP